MVVLKYIERYKNEFKESISDLKNRKTFYKQIPNLLTFSRLVLALPFGFLYYVNPVLSIGGMIFLWGTDAIDGKIARKLNIQSKLGADMDTIADKIMFLASSIPLMSNVSILILNFILEGVISLVNVGGRINGLDTKTVLSGKIKTVSLSITLIFGYLVQYLRFPVSIFNVLIGLTTLFQVISINDYIKEIVRMNNELKKENNFSNCDIVVEDFDKDSLDKENQMVESLASCDHIVIAPISHVYDDIYSQNIKVRKKND